MTETRVPELHDGFVQEGQFLALELAVPHECRAIDDDASAIRRLAVGGGGRLVHGVTTGERAHLFTALFKGAAGGVVNLGVLEAEPACLLRCPDPESSRRELVITGHNDDRGFELRGHRVYVIGDVLQEPGFRKPAPRPVARIPDAAVTHAVAREQGERVACLCADRVVVLSTATGEIEAEAATPGAPPDGARLHARDGGLLWVAARDRVAWWGRGDAGPTFRALSEPLPPEPIVHASPRPDGRLLLVMRGGAVLVVDPEGGRLAKGGATPLAPVQTAAALPDGRVYAMCGDELAHFARVEVPSGAAEPLGAVASALSARRYGFRFACAAASDEGVLFFGEHDRRGHLWAYYPPLPAAGKGGPAGRPATG